MAEDATPRRAKMGAVRVAYTLEQCWHRVPGGTAIAALRIATALSGEADVELVGVAGRHRDDPAAEWRPPVPVRQLPLSGAALYEGWLRLRWPTVERVTGAVDVAHATTIIPCASKAPLVATIHDLAFMRDPSHFTRRGNSVFRRSLAILRRRAALVLCSSRATMDDCEFAGLGADRLRHVPLGVDVQRVDDAATARVRARYQLPERFALFVGTVEPRKNLARLAAAVQQVDAPLPLVVAGAAGWGDVAVDGNVRFLGFVPGDELPALYRAAAVFCYPSIREGYGLPVLEAMAQGTPVVTSRGTSTEEAAGGAAVLVDPTQVGDIARGVSEALADRDRLAALGAERAAATTWVAAATATLSCYREVAG